MAASLYNVLRKSKMAEYSRHKSLSRDFDRVRIDENDLARLGAIVSGLAERFGGSPEFRIVSGDGEETIRTGDPDFFVGQHMLPQIRSVSISYHNYQAPVSCCVELGAFPHNRASLSADGSDRDIVSGVYHELERELEGRQVLGVKCAKHLDGFFVHFLVSLMVASAIFSVFDFVLDLASATIVSFKGSDLHEVLVGIGTACVFIGLFIGGFQVIELLQRVFPALEFAGRLSDPNTVSRKRLIWVITVILLPIAVNVVSNLLTAGLGQ